MDENPYTPPAALGAGDAAAPGQPPAAAGGITFNDYDLERVSRATTWMRTVSALHIFFGSVLALLTLFTAFTSLAVIGQPLVLIGVAILASFTLVLLLGGIWLRQSCVAFYDGINANAESGLAMGFRKLRLYFILYGLIGLLGLVPTVLALVR